MSRKSSRSSASSRDRQQAPKPAPPRAADGEVRQAASPDFPFARNPEEDELRDMTGYGWGV